MQENKKKALIICGPTASGKTDYAHRLGLRQKGGAHIVNCDSMQVYKQLPIITASPEEKLRKELPYHLYNYKDISEDFSVAAYIKKADEVIRKTANDGALPIIVGGTGMYISALLKGINYVPDIDEEIRAMVRNQCQGTKNDSLHTQLQAVDPRVAARLHPGDSQRIMRALEVFLQTGKSIAEFQQQEPVNLLADFDFKVIILQPSRDLLYKMCNKRLEKMFACGVVDEVKSILLSGAKFGQSSSKALGVAQILSYLKGEMSKKEALTVAATKTRQYAKRQTTWFAHQIPNKQILNNQVANKQIPNKHIIAFETIAEFQRILDLE